MKVRHVTVGGRLRATATLLTLSLAVGLGACSSDGDSPPASSEPGSGSPGTGNGVADDFQQNNLLVTAVCSPDPAGGGLVQVDGWNPESWERLAHTEFRLPPSVFTVDVEGRKGPISALEELCEQDDIFSRGDVAAIRSLFDQDFTKIAVVIWDQEVNSYHVGYVDRSGEVTDLTGTEDFGLTPKEEGAVLSADGGTVYFTDEDDDHELRVGSRPVAGGDQPTYLWTGDEDSSGTYIDQEYLVPVGTPSRVVVGDGWARLSPGGQRLLVPGYVLDLPAETTVITPSVWQEDGAQVACGFDWVGDDALLCGGDGGQSAGPATLDLGAGAGAERGEDILPPNDRKNDYMVVSPDGRQFAFRSRLGSETSYFVAGTQPGSAPTMIPQDSEFVTLGERAWFIDWL